MSSEKQMQEMDQEELAMREEISSQVFGDDDESFATPAANEHQEEAKIESQVAEQEKQPAEDQQDDEQPPEEKKDPLESLKKDLGDLKQTLSGFKDVSYRLKQVESRVGSIQNEFHAAKQAAKQTDNAPSKEEMAEAAKSKEKWEELKEEYPEWDEILEAIPDLVSKPVDIDALKNELREELKQETPQPKGNLDDELLAISIAHRDWRDEIKTPEWGEYLNTLSPEDRAGVTGSNSSSVVIAALNSFKAFKADKQAKEHEQSDKAAEIVQKRNQRVERSVAQHSTKTGKKIPKPKSEKDMTEDELRARVADEVFNED